jgi:antitoxin HicB
MTREGNRVLISFPDFPNIHTFGDDEAEALARGADALETMIAAMIADREDIPEPSRAKGKSINLSALAAAKIALYRLMRAEGIGKAELGRRLNCHLPQVDRLLDLRHASRFDQVEAAFGVLGKRLEIQVRDAA